MIMTTIKWIYIICTNLAVLSILLSIYSAHNVLKEKYPSLCEWNKNYNNNHDTDWADIAQKILMVGFFCFCPLLHIGVLKIAFFEFDSFRDTMVDKTIRDIKLKRQKDWDKFKDSIVVYNDDTDEFKNFTS